MLIRFVLSQIFILSRLFVLSQISVSRRLPLKSSSLTTVSVMPRESAPLGVSALDERHILTTVPHLYERAGLPIVLVERLPQKELGTYETTWAKRLAFGRSREVWRVRAKYVSEPG